MDADPPESRHQVSKSTWSTGRHCEIICQNLFPKRHQYRTSGIVCKDLPDDVKTGDTMELHMSEGTAVANGKTYSCTKLPEYMQNILNQGGLDRFSEPRGGSKTWE